MRVIFNFFRLTVLGVVLSMVGCKYETASGEAVAPDTTDVHGLHEKNSGYAANSTDWKIFMDCWLQAARVRHQEAAKTDSDLPFLSLLARPHGDQRPGISEADMDKSIKSMEAKLGIDLPNSYRDFLIAQNAWLKTDRDFRTMNARPSTGMYGVEKIGKFKNIDPEYWSLFQKFEIHSSDRDFYTYGARQDSATGRTKYTGDAVVVGKYSDDSFAYILLYPKIRTNDGEMQASLLQHSGEFRAPSFAELMRQLSVLETTPVDSMPAYPQKSLSGTCASKLPMRNIWWE